MKNRLTLKTLNKVLQKKYPGIEVVKDNGFFYLYSDDKELSLKIAGLYQSSIHVNSVNQFTLDRWIIEVNNLFNNSENI